MCERDRERCIHECFLVEEVSEEEESKPKHLRKACVATPRKLQGSPGLPNNGILALSFVEKPSISSMSSFLDIAAPTPPLVPVSLFFSFSPSCLDQIQNIIAY